MRKIAVFTLLGFFVPFSVTLFSLTSWSGDYVTHTPEAIVSPPLEISTTNLPLDAPEDMIPDMEEQEDAGLQKEIEQLLISDKHLRELVRQKKLSIGVVDMHDPLNARFAAINGNHMMYAASLPKIAVLLAATDALDKGMIKDSPEIAADMRLMIAKSNNAATSRMIERVGMDHIAEVLQDPCYDLYDEESGGGLWVGKLYGRGGKRIGDPIKNLSHAASVTQVCKYYYMLAFGQLVSPERSSQMLDMLVDPQLHHKFVHVLDRIAPGAKVYRKSGTWKTWHADSAMVWDETRRYIVVALAEDDMGETILRNLMQKIDQVLIPRV